MTDAPVLEPQSPYRKATPRSENRNIPNCYWRRGPRESNPGYIIVGDGEETRQADRWKRKGRTPLPQYSLTDRKSPKTGAPEPIEYSEDSLDRERYYWFFKNGGAKEFPVEQIVEYKWHINPPYGLSVDAFPQLADYILPEPLWCQVCPPSKPPFNSAAQVVQHGMISHKLSLPDAKALLEDADKPPAVGGLAPAIRRKDEMTAEKVAERKRRGEKLAAEVGDIKVADPKRTICNSCGIEIAGRLADHHC